MSKANIKVAFTALNVAMLALIGKGITQEAYDSLTPLMSAQRAQSSTAIRNVAGDVIGLKCTHYNRHMPLVGDNAVEFGTKASSSTGLNSVCKDGANEQARKTTAYNTAKNDLMEAVAENPATATTLKADLVKIEKARHMVATCTLGFETEEELVKALTAMGQKIAVADA